MRAGRFLARNRALAAAAIGSLALGIGGNATIYNVVREMILDDLSALSPQCLVRFGAGLTQAQYRDLLQTRIFQNVALYRSFTIRNWRTGDHSEMVWTIETSPNFFDVLGVRASPSGAGRLYGAGDREASAVAGYAFWKRRMGGHPGALGRPVEINGWLYRLAGVLPEDYRSVYGLGIAPEIYLPASLADSDTRLWIAFARLRDGQSAAAARQELAASAARLWGAEFAGRFSSLRPMAGFAAHTVVEGNGFYLFFVALFAVAGMMALISCANVAGLLTARGLSRRRELAIRQALGASRWQLARPVLAEASLLAAAGTVAGLLLETFLAARLRSVRFPSAYGVPFEFHFRDDSGLLLYAAAAALVAVVVSALGPALSASAGDPGWALKQAAPALSVRRWNARNGFVAAQMALAVMLLSVGALFLRSFAHVATADLGFDAAHILIAGAQPMAAAPGYRERLVRSILAQPGVRAATSASIFPLAGELPKSPLRREGDAAPLGDVYVAGVGERYFETMGIPVLRGRDFRATDRRVAIVNRALARRFFGDADPVGRLVRIGRDHPEPVEIVGLAADSKLRSLGEENVAAVYLPELGTGLLVRVAGAPEQWIEPLRRAMAQVDPRAALDVRPLTDAVAGGLFPMRMAALLVGSLSAAGLLLALVGLYAAVHHAVGRRTREMGIRMALGATRARIVWTTLSESLALLVLAGAAGLVLAVFVIRPLVGIVPDGVNPWSPAQFAAVPALLLAAGAMAALVPARRAARAEASAALREE